MPPVASATAAKNKIQTEEKDSHSKVSTASTNEEPNLYLIKIGSGQTGSSSDSKPIKKKVTVKVKKTAKMSRPNANDCLDEETKSIIDNQLDQLVIHKPPQLTNQIQGKDRSLKEAFLRRPPNNLITVMYGPIPGRAPTVFFNYPPFLQIQRPYRQDKI